MLVVQILRAGLSLTMASLTAPIVVTGLGVAAGNNLDHNAGAVLVVAWLVSLAHLFALGVPGFLLLRRYRVLNGRTIALWGLLAGAVPVGVLTWPIGGNGVASPHGWFSYAQGVASCGVLGALSAVVFLGAWRKLGCGNSPAPPARR